MRPPSTQPLVRGRSLPLVMLGVLAVVLVILLWWQRGDGQETVVATVGDAVIRQQELSLALRAQLWRKDVSWSTLNETEQAAERQQALEALVDEKLAEKFLQRQSLDQNNVLRAGEQEFQQFIKQFEGTDAWQPRAAAQRLTEQQLRESFTRQAALSLALDLYLREYAAPPTEAQARSWHEQHQARFIVPETAHASHLFLTVHDTEKPAREDDIRAYHQQLVQGLKTLPQLAAEFSDDPRTQKTGGNLGWFSRERVPADFAAKVFSMKPGELSPPFRTRLGWHIVQLHDKRPARPAAFDEARQEIMAHLHDQARLAALQQWRRQQRAKTPLTLHTERLKEVQPPPAF